MTSDKPPPRSNLEDALVEDVRAFREEAMAGPETPDGRRLGQTVGENLSSLRERAGKTLADLADDTGISVGTLAALEAGQAVPSLRAVWLLATALRTPFGALLDRDDASADDFFVRRAGEGQRIASADDRFHSRVLFRQGDARMPEVYELTLAPGCVEPAAAHAPGSFEHIVVVEGVLVIVVGSREERLEAGDTIFFPADSPHSYENPGQAPTVAHLVMHHEQGS